MAGSAANLSSNLANIVGAPSAQGTGQQLLLQQLGQYGAGMFSGGAPAVDPNDPESLRAEAKRLMAAGDQAGALEMAGQARSAETAARGMRAEQQAGFDRTRDANDKRMAAAGASIDEGSAELEQMKATSAAVQALEAKGFTQEAELVKSGAITPAQGLQALGEQRRDETAAKGEERRAKLAAVKAVQKAAAETEEQKKEISANFKLLQQSDPERFAKMVKTYGPTMQTASPEEVKVLHALTSRASFMGTEDDSGVFDMEASSATQKKIAYEQFEGRLNEMVGKNDMAEDSWGPSNDVSGYALLLAEYAASLAARDNLDDIAATETVMSVMDEVATEGMSVVDMSSALDKYFKSTPADGAWSIQ